MPLLRYQPPAVQYRVAPPTAARVAGWGLWWVGAALLLAWGIQGGVQPWAVMGAGWLLWGVAGGVWACWVRGLPQGSLRWDGGAWWWVPEAVAAEPSPLQHVRVLWDWQSAMGLAWQAADGGWRHGIALQRSAPWRWGDWRRAVYSAATVSRTAEKRF